METGRRQIKKSQFRKNAPNCLLWKGEELKVEERVEEVDVLDEATDDDSDDKGRRIHRKNGV